LGRRYAYLFPGQGSQYVGMGHDLYENYPAARNAFAQADDVLGIRLSRMCFEGPSGVLDDTVNTQPAILATSVAALRVLEVLGLEPPDYVAGHSMGEFSSLVAAGVLSFEEGLRLVRERGALMKDAGLRRPGGMAAILGLERPSVEDVCVEACEETGAYVGVANDNCPGQIVLSGAKPALRYAMEIARTRGAKRAIPLAVSIAAHSPLMEDAAVAFAERLAATPLEEPTVPIVMNALAQPVRAPELIRDALAQQLTSPVRWTESMSWMVAQGVDVCVEIGPKDVLTNLLRRIDRSTERMTTSDAVARYGAAAAPSG